MLDAPPREREWVSWAWAGLWTLCIYASIPAARAIQESVRDRWGTDTFAAIVIAVVLAAVVVALRLRRHRPARARTPGSALWLGAVAVVFVGYTIRLRANAEEALHFVQYGLLGLLLYRALVHRLRDPGVYVTAALLGVCAGIVDEAIQWLTPRRYWGLRDVWLNAFAVSLTQLGIAFGLRPALVSGAPGPQSVRWMCRSAAAALLLLGASLLNTPARTAWLADRIPGLAFLRENESTMLEYGHRYEHPEAGVFRSRLAPDELARADRERADEVAAILDAHRGRKGYERFLVTYTPVTDPFAHEARVHLFRRDRYRQNALRAQERGDPAEARTHFTVAWHEQRILELYFPTTLARSSYALPDPVREELDRQRIPGIAYESAVSQNLVTRVDEAQIGAALALLLAGLAVADRRFGRER